MRCRLAPVIAKALVVMVMGVGLGACGDGVDLDMDIDVDFGERRGMGSELLTPTSDEA